ncbi:MAG TPA: hypothetical protein VHR47_04130, partial [Bacillota bacterium]|nr:hypothetical protein [Bacillota bacterium]
DLTQETLHAFRDTGGGYLPMADAESIVGDLFGLQSPGLFLSTLMVSQGDVAGIEDGKIGEAIAAKVASGEDSPSATAAIHWLERALNDLTREGRSTSTFSALQHARNQINDWQSKFDALSESAVCEEEWVREFNEVLSKIRQKEHFKEVYGPMVQSFDAFQRIKGEYEAIRQRLEELLKTVARIDQAATDWQNAQKEWVSWSGRGVLAVERRPEIERTYVEYCNAVERLAILKDRKSRLMEELRLVEEQSKSLETNQGSSPTREGWKQYLQSKEQYSSLVLQHGDTHEQLIHLEKGRRLGILGMVSLLTGIAVIGAAAIVHLGQNVFVISLPVGSILFVFGLWLFLKSRHTAGERRRIEYEAEEMQRELNRLEAEMQDILGPLTPEYYENAVQDLENRQRERDMFAGRNAALKEASEGLDEEIQAQEEIGLALHTALHNAWYEAGAADQNEYRRNCRIYDEVLSKEHLAKEKLDTLLHDKNRSEWESELANLTASCRILESKMDGLRLDVDALTIEEYRQKLLTVDRELAELYQEKAVLNDRLTASRQQQGEEDRYQIAAELEYWKEEERNTLDRAAGVQQALKLLREASEEVHATLAPILADRAAEIFSRVARGRYRDVRVAGGLDGDEPFRMEVLIPETQQWVGPASLSSGARDQLYLALRIALAEYLTGHKDMPLILDDPFLHYDPVRLAAAVGLLKEMGEERQIIWLTKDPRLAEDFPGVETIYFQG